MPIWGLVAFAAGTVLLGLGELVLARMAVRGTQEFAKTLAVSLAFIVLGACGVYVGLYELMCLLS